MKTIEQTLDNWLEEYSANKKLRYKLTVASKENPEGIIPDTAMIMLSKKEIEVLAKGLDIILQSNKESIIDCSYNFVQARKNKNNAEQIMEDNTHLEQTNKQRFKKVKQETADTKKIDICDANQEKVINKFKTNVHIENVKMFEELLETLSTIEKSIVIYPKFKINLENKNEKELVTIISHILRELNDEALATLHDDICESSAMLQYNDLLKYRFMLKDFIELGGILLIKIDILER